MADCELRQLKQYVILFATNKAVRKSTLSVSSKGGRPKAFIIHHKNECCKQIICCVFNTDHKEFEFILH